MGHIIGLEIHNLSNQIKRSIIGMLGHEPSRVTHMHGFVIDYLYANRDHPVYQRDLEAHLAVRRSTVSRMIALMEKNGVLTRESVPGDGRLKRLVLTPEAIALHQRVMAARDELETRMIRNVDPDDLETFFRVIRQIEENLKET